MFTTILIIATVMLAVLVALAVLAQYYQEPLKNFLRFLSKGPQEEHKKKLGDAPPLWPGSQWVLWAIVLTPVLVGLIMFEMTGGPWYSIGGILLSTFLIYISLNEIPADPPHVGIPTFWGKRLERVEKEGLKLFLPFFPFFYDFIPILVEKRNEDFAFTVRCRLEEDVEVKNVEDEDSSVFEQVRDIVIRNKAKKPQAGGEVEVHVGITWEPDYESGQKRPDRLHNFINAGRDEGIHNIINDVVGEDFRQLGRKLSWVHMNFGTDILGMLLVYALTGARVPKLLYENGKPSLDENGKYIIAREDPSDLESPKITKHPLDDTSVVTEEECKHYLEAVTTNGLSDVRDLGIKIRRVNVAEVKAIGELVKDAEQAARERQQRAMQREQLTTRQQGMRFARDEMNIGDDVSDAQLWDYLLVEEKVVPRTIRDVRVTSARPGELSDAAGVLSTGGNSS